MAALRLIISFAALLPAAGPAGALPAGSWAPEVAEAAERFGVPEDWISRVIEAESGGRTSLLGRPITSRAGAMGLMQVMPGTWQEMRLIHGLGNDPYQPRDNILAGAAYLRSMYDRFGYPGMFAAYNAGPSRYAAFLAGSRSLPLETRAYVARIAPAGDAARDTRSEPRPGLFAIAAAPDRVRAEPKVGGDVSAGFRGLFVRLSGLPGS